MKEILLKFETEELFNRFIENIVIPKIENPTTTQLEFDFENNIGIISDNKENEL